MNSSAKAGRFIRGASEREDVFVLGELARHEIPSEGTLATAGAVVAAADRRAAEIVAAAEAQAATIIAQAQGSAGSVRGQAHREGYAAGLAGAEAEARAAIELIRRVAGEGQAIRDEIAGQATGVIARAISLALRRLVAEYYEADPARTAAAIADAVRAAAGQQIISIRVHSGLVQSLQAQMLDIADYIRPDDAIEAGGCIIDLKNGTLDATLDARLSLMELALREAGGEVQQ
jgi:flagellar biosynthesis/type III secretory pathway protein FliH